MGEKIKDIGLINLIGNNLMVELNEGYTKEQGRVIHIQDPKFRYLLTEKQFYETASQILRAADELTYIKSHYIKCQPIEKEKNTTIESFPILPILNESEIDYRIIDFKNKIITLMIKIDDLKNFKRFVKENKMKKLQHPYGKKHGYQFLYQMKEFEIYEKQNFYYEIFYQLPCRSLTPKMWMPLDRMIQQSVWETCQIKDSLKYLSEEDYYIYKIVECIFEKKYFDSLDRDFFVSNKKLVNSESLQQKLSMVLFKFSPVILKMLENEDIDNIIDFYYSNKNY